MAQGNHAARPYAKGGKALLPLGDVPAQGPAVQGGTAERQVCVFVPGEKYVVNPDIHNDPAVSVE
jgi:hypothetical protein